MKKQDKLWDKFYKNNSKWNKETSSISKQLKGKSVLEIGVGNGKTLIAILRQYPRKIVAIDNSLEAVNIVNKDFSNNCLEVFNADVLDLPFENESFDFVVCYYVLNNLLIDERERAIKEIFRVLKKKGNVLFEDFAVEDFREKGKKVEKNTIIKKNGIICHFFQIEELKKLLKIFSKIRLDLKISNPIIHKTHLIRKIIIGRAEK